MLIRQLDDDLRIERVLGREAAARWRDAFTSIYPGIFSTAPYFEDISVEQATSRWDFLTAAKGHITLLALTGSDRLVGFGIALPVSETQLVATALAGLVPHKHTLGVLPEDRDRGLGRTLVQERMKLIDPKKYSHVVLRVTAEKNTSYDLYQSMGFEDMGVYMDVSAKRTDGTIGTDKRLFLSRVLSQVDVE
jgi:ribosomal protein S18 acetylase RimI-like enzyme